MTSRLTLLLVFSSSLVSAQFFNYLPSSSHHDDFNKHALEHGQHYDGDRGFAKGYHGSEYDAASGKGGYYGSKYGDAAEHHGMDKYANADGHGKKDAMHEEDARAAKESEGLNKYSYFTSGSGPEGSYSKGYYGSEGYDHENSKAQQAADASGAGFHKGYNMEANNEEQHKNKYDSETGSQGAYGREHDSDKYGHEMGKYNRGGHDDGWFNDFHADGAARKGGYY